MSHHPPTDERDILLLKLTTVEPFIKYLEEKRSQLELDLLKAEALHPYDPSAQADFLSGYELRPGEYVPSHSLIDADLENAAHRLGEQFSAEINRARKELRDFGLAVWVLNRQAAEPERLGAFFMEFMRAARVLIRAGLRPAHHLRGQLLAQLAPLGPASMEYVHGRTMEQREASRVVNVFRRHGHGWSVSYRGSELFAVEDSRGASCIHYLLERPGRWVAAAELDGYWDSLQAPGRRHLGTDELGSTSSRDDGPVMDAVAYQRCREEWTRIEDELAEAEDNNDLSRVAELKAQRQRLAQSVSDAMKPGGKPARIGDRSQRVTDRVTKAIRRIMLKLGATEPSLYRHLERAITTGLVCKYEPEEQTPWEL